jgi:hypothetical protein
MLPLVPVTVRGYVPGGVLMAVVIVNVEAPLGVTEAGEKPAEAPVGRPEMARAMGPEKLAIAVVPIEYVADVPWNNVPWNRLVKIANVGWTMMLAE